MHVLTLHSCLHALTLNENIIIKVKYSANWHCKLAATVMARAFQVFHSTLIYAGVLCRFLNFGRVVGTPTHRPLSPPQHQCFPYQCCQANVKNVLNSKGKQGHQMTVTHPSKQPTLQLVSCFVYAIVHMPFMRALGIYDESGLESINLGYI